ncbi:unnamed protein product [Cladocopium goreaui]|uniref:Uncharacterized protein n=1 Tax=Cladocopium goreaui TaxID=2562237 RepID=A0A9P1FXD9_9DINO|nr:unnamed protein product [Cladocopium goreaui]
MAVAVAGSLHPAMGSKPQHGWHGAHATPLKGWMPEGRSVALVASGLCSLGRCSRHRHRWQRSASEADPSPDLPSVGRRLRVWFVSEDDLADYEYGTVSEVHDDGEVTIQWDGQGEERLDLSDISFEWLGHDFAADLMANLRESRQESLEGATEAGAEVVAMPVEQLRKELSAMSWMRKELEARRRQAEELRRENEELKAAREDFHRRYGKLLPDRSQQNAQETKRETKREMAKFCIPMFYVSYVSYTSLTCLVLGILCLPAACSLLAQRA